MARQESPLGERLITPTDPRYDEARRLWNGLLDPRPAAIAPCADVSDVVEAIALARQSGLTLSVRGGGHGVGGRACRDGSLVIDLRGMRGVSVDATARVARAEGGATWGDFDGATSAHGLATPGGLISSTGIGGLTLGGGVGWLVRKHGLSCDNLVGAEVVTADGRIRAVNAGSEGELFWALRGAGFGFGVVTALEYALHPVSEVIAGMVMHPAGRAGEVVRYFRDFCASSPDELTAILAFAFPPPAPFVPEEMRDRPVVMIAVCWSGEHSAGERVLAPLRAFGPPAVDMIGPMPYTATQTMLDPTAPPNQLNYWKSAFLPALSDDAIAAIVARGTALQSPLAMLHVHQLGGAMSRVAPGSTAFERRSAGFLVNIPTMWTDPAEADRMVAWTRASYAEIARSGGKAGYINFQDRDENRREAWTSQTVERLRRVKTMYDPDALFGNDPVGASS